MYYVYILRCEDNSLYTGITTDVKRRFSEHKGNEKGAKYTKTRKPIKIEAVWETDNRVNASRLEYRIKKCPKPWKEDIINNKKDVISLLLRYNEEIYLKKVDIPTE